MSHSHWINKCVEHWNAETAEQSGKLSILSCDLHLEYATELRKLFEELNEYSGGD